MWTAAVILYLCVGLALGETYIKMSNAICKKRFRYVHAVLYISLVFGWGLLLILNMIRRISGAHKPS